uniref:Eukaryotic translation initiation factor 3 subunit M n=1 Tax=Canis lupus familiaris TaxID=9615 RepID=A0A8C0TAB8_CANLF
MKLARVSPRVELEVTFLIKSWASLEKMNMEPNLVPHPGIQRVGRRAEVHGGRGQPGGPLLLFCIHHLQGKHIQRDGDVLGMRCSSQLCWEDKTPTLPHNSPCAGAAELRAYLKSKGAEISEENSEGGLHVDLAQIIEACDVCLKEDDKDVESVMNSVVSLLLILEPDKQEALIESLCEKLVKFREGERPSLRLQLLSNLFHGMDKNTPVRYTVYCSLIKVAASCGAIQYIPTELDQVRKWISDWNLTTEKKHTLLRLLYEALVDCKKSDAASKVMVELLGSYTEDNASQARVDAHRCIVRALKDPNAFLFDHLLTLKPVKFLEGELIHDLLTIFVSAKLASYVKFYQNNKDFIDSLGLLHEQNMAKMRLLTFMGMAVENKEISFDTMQQELQIGADDVEAFVIDAVRTKMVYCKIDQTQRKVVVSHSTHRTFGKQQWQQLYDTLNAWKQNLNKVKNSLLSLSDT